MPVVSNDDLNLFDPGAIDVETSAFNQKIEKELLNKSHNAKFNPSRTLREGDRHFLISALTISDFLSKKPSFSQRALPDSKMMQLLVHNTGITPGNRANGV